MGQPPAIRIRAAPLGLAVALTLAAAAAFKMAPMVRSPMPPRQGPLLAQARSWGYQLQNVAPSDIADDIDLLVVDYSRDGSGGRAFTTAEVDELRHRRNGRLRIVVAYLSIGEAESYRDYWQSQWLAAPPSWLGVENSAWKGNYAVQFWDPGWQRLIVAPEVRAATVIDRVQDMLFGAPPTYLEAIMSAGFDGVYLDRVDAYEKAQAARPSAGTDMISFVSALSRVAKARRPGFLVLAQNAEELLAEPGYIRALDGVAKEDLLYGEKGDGLINPPSGTRQAIGYLQRARSAGLPVFTVEYVSDPDRQRSAIADWAALGFIGTFATRALNTSPTLPH